MRAPLFGLLIAAAIVVRLASDTTGPQFWVAPRHVVLRRRRRRWMPAKLRHPMDAILDTIREFAAGCPA